MSDERFAEGEATVYDDNGKTCVPASVRDAMGIGEGSKLIFRYVDGSTLVQTADKDAES